MKNITQMLTLKFEFQSNTSVGEMLDYIENIGDGMAKTLLSILVGYEKVKKNISKTVEVKLKWGRV